MPQLKAVLRLSGLQRTEVLVQSLRLFAQVRHNATVESCAAIKRIAAYRSTCAILTSIRISCDSESHDILISVWVSKWLMHFHAGMSALITLRPLNRLYQKIVLMANL